MAEIIRSSKPTAMIRIMMGITIPSTMIVPWFHTRQVSQQVLTLVPRKDVAEGLEEASAEVCIDGDKDKNYDASNS